MTTPQARSLNRSAIVALTALLTLTASMAVSASISARRTQREPAELKEQLAAGTQKVETPERESFLRTASLFGTDNRHHGPIPPVEPDGFPAPKWLQIAEIAAPARNLN